MTASRLIVIGAGPIGLEAALNAVHCGFDVTVLEQGHVGQAIEHWGHVRFFTPFRMNSSAAGRQTITSTGRLPADDAILSGHDYCQQYLQPLAHCPELNGRVLEQHQLLAVSRMTCGTSDRIGQPDRNEQPFRLLVRTPQGERILYADILIDCTGFTGRHRWVGAGGMPCPGETTCLTASSYRIPDVLGSDRSWLSGQHVAVIGSGYSAATSVCALAELAENNSDTRITWITRGNRTVPVDPVANDALPERAQLISKANAVAATAPQYFRWIPGPLIENMTTVGSGQVQLDLSWPDQSRTQQITVDAVIANPGYRPDTRPFEELQIHRCYATEGPIRMAAHLLGETSGDCMNQSSGGVDLLKNPEPDFYILGAASYARDSRFLLQTGLQQIADLFEHILNPSAVAAQQGATA
jgi:thioredoxin reductase